MKRRVLVLLAAYNGEAYLSDQMRSILSQVGVEVRVVVSVDRSSDRTHEVASKLAASESRVTLLKDQGYAGGAAQNFYRLLTSVSYRDVDFVALADQDDIWESDKLRRAISVLETEEASAYSSNVIAWDGNPQMHGTVVDKAQSQRRWDWLFSSAGPGCTYVLAVEGAREFTDWLRAHLVAANQIDYHDWLIYAWYRSRGRRWIIDPTSTMYYRQHDNNQLGANRGWRAARRRVSRIRSGWYQEQVVQIADVLELENVGAARAIRASGLFQRLKILREATHLRRQTSHSLLAAISVALSRGHAK